MDGKSRKVGKKMKGTGRRRRDDQQASGTGSGKEGKAKRGEKPRDRPGLVPLGLSVPETGPSI